MRILISLIAMICISFSMFGQWSSSDELKMIDKHMRYQSTYNFTLSSLSNNSVLVRTGDRGVFANIYMTYGGDTLALTTWAVYISRNVNFTNQATGYTNIKYLIGKTNEQQSSVSNVWDCVDLNFNSIYAPAPMPVQTWYKIGTANPANKWTGLSNYGTLIGTFKSTVVGAQYPYSLPSPVELAPNTYYFVQLSNSTAADSNLTVNFNLLFTVLR